jgi:hypothetical protein
MRGLLGVAQPLAQWDSDKFYRLVEKRVGSQVSIGYLGGGEAFDKPQFQHPWVRRRERVSVQCLWAPRSNVAGLSDLTTEATRFDVVVVGPADTPGFRFRNQFNNALIRYLSEEPSYSRPVTLLMGTTPEEAIVIFFREVHHPQ